MDYRLTEIGLKLDKVVFSICDWGDDFQIQLKVIIIDNERTYNYQKFSPKRVWDINPREIESGT